MIIAGPAQPTRPTAYARAVAELAAHLGWPVLAAARSPLRNHADFFPHGLVTSYESILRAAVPADRLRPEVVIVLGSQLPTSKTLRAWLTAADAPTWYITDSPLNPDALHARTQVLRTTPQLLAAQIPAAEAPNAYARMWATYETEARAKLEGYFETLSPNELFEGRASWLLAKHLPANTTVAFANSMPIRDAEYFWAPNARRLRPAFSRGANGIDGTLSTALGLAHDNLPTVLLTGDLALLHDTNGFLQARNLRGHLTIILINNEGGGIFQHLPVSQFDPPFEKFSATPQAVDFAQLAKAYAVEHTLVRDWPHFIELISALPETGVRVLELRTNRKSDAATRKTLLNSFAAAFVSSL